MRLGPQPARVLQLLLETPGEVVPRDRIREALWPSGTHVEFEMGLNAAVNRLRRVLNDSADRPRYIETLPRVGYRFVAPVEREADSPVVEAPVAPPQVALAATPRRRGWKAWAAVAAVVCCGGLGWAIWARGGGAAGGPKVEPHILLPISLPAGASITDLAVSPQGDHVVYSQSGPHGRAAYRRFLNEDYSRRVTGADDARRIFFSPDGNLLGVVTGSAVLVVTPDGHTREVAQVNGNEIPTVHWGADGYIYFSNTAGKPGVWRVPSSGRRSEPESVIPYETKPAGGEYVFSYGFVGQGLLYTTRTGPSHNELRIRTGSSVRTLHHAVRGGMFGGGMLVYEDRDQLVGEPFDAASQTMSETRIVLAEGVEARGWPGPVAAMNDSGMLAFLRDRVLDPRKVVWVDRSTGAATDTRLSGAEEYEYVRISPTDPATIALVTRKAPERRSAEIVNLETGTRRELISALASSPRPIWAPDGRSIVINSEKDNGDFGNLYRLQVTGEQGAMARLTEQPSFGQFPVGWSRSGAEILFEEGVHPGTKSDLLRYSFADGSVRPFRTSPGWDVDAVFAPDGARVAFSSDHSGKMMVYTADHPGTRAPKAIAEGRGPIFVDGGKRILFCRDGKFAEIAADGSGGLVRDIASTGTGPDCMFDIWTRPYDLSADGSRVLTIMRLPPEPKQRVIEVVRNVGAEFRARVR